MEKGRTLETLTGLFVLIVAVAFFFYAYQKSGWVRGDIMTLTAYFDKADGLVEGTDVKISGIRVGKIMSTSVDPDNLMAVVKFYIPAGMKLSKDTSASVSSEGLLGSKYLALIPGGQEEDLKDGDSIDNTTGPISIESLINKFISNSSSKED